MISAPATWFCYFLKANEILDKEQFIKLTQASPKLIRGWAQAFDVIADCMSWCRTNWFSVNQFNGLMCRRYLWGKKL
jgi:hypothetical protein